MAAVAEGEGTCFSLAHPIPPMADPNDSMHEVAPPLTPPLSPPPLIPDLLPLLPVPMVTWHKSKNRVAQAHCQAPARDIQP